MRYYEENPSSLILVNPGKPKRPRKARKSKGVKNASQASVKARRREAVAQKAVAAKLAGEVKKAKSAAKTAKLRAKAAVVALREEKRELKEQLKAERAAAKAARREASAAKKEAATMARGKRNPKKAKKVKRSVGFTGGALTQVAAAKRKAPTKAEKKTRRVGGLAAREKRQAFLTDKKVESNAAVLGLTPLQAFNQYRTKSALQKAASAARQGVRGAAKAEKLWTPTREKLAKTLGIPKGQALDMTVAELRAQAKIVKEAAKLAKARKAAARKASKAARSAAFQQRKLASAERKKTMRPKGTTLADLANEGILPRNMPPEPDPSMVADMSRRSLVTPWPWRPPIESKPDPGWYWVPAKKGGFKLVKNPGAKKRRKARKPKGLMARGKATLRKLPVVGGLFGKKSKKGRKNPDFSITEVAKIAVAGGVGYVGGGMFDGLATGMLSSWIDNPKLASGLGGALTIGVAHLVTKSSAYYVPVVAGASIAAIKGFMRSEETVAGYDPGAGFVGNVKGMASETFGGLMPGKVAEGMGFMPSNDELMSAIDADMGEYVDIAPMGEYVDIDPMGEYVDMSLEEYVDIAPMGEYVDVGFDEGDVEELADEYAPPIADVGYGELHPQEAINMGSYEELADDSLFFDDDEGDFGEYEELASYEELAGDYADLAEEYESAANLGAVSNSQRAELLRKAQEARAASKASSAKTGTGSGQRSKTLAARRRYLAQGNSRRSWANKLAASAGTSKGAAVAKNFNKAVQQSIVEATQNTAFKTGSRDHFRTAFTKFSRAIGGSVPEGMRKAFLVSYRGKTQGEAAALKAAKDAGVPAEAAAVLAKGPAPEPLHQIAESGGPGGVERVGGTLARRARRQPRYRRVRKAGESARDFGGIFRHSIYGRRGRWQNY